MSFFGGGTDIPSFFNENGGAVISTTFDKYCYVNVRHLPPFMPYLSELVYSKIERVNNIDDIVHPLIRECMRLHDIHEIRLTYEGDLPARTGLGTSSTFAVGMLNAFCALKGKMMSKAQLAQEAIQVERDILKEHGGWQDQIAAAFGGLNRIDFKDNQFKVSPIVIHPDRKEQLDNSLMLFYTGVTRFSSDVQKDTFAKPEDKKVQLKEMLTLVDDAQAILEDKNADMNAERYVILVTKKGVIKKTDLADYTNSRSFNKGIRAINIREGDELLDALLTDGRHEIMIAARKGRCCRFDEEQLRSLGRNSSGVRGINIDDDDEVIGAICCDPSAEDAALRTILVVSENGFGKRTDVQEYRKTARGAKGVRTINITDKTGPLVAIKSVTEENDLMIINKSGLTIRMSVKDIRVAGRATQGVKLINIREGDAIAAVCPVAGAEDAPEEMSEETVE